LSFVWLRAKDSIVPFVVDMAVLWIATIGLTARWRHLEIKERLIAVWLDRHARS